MTENTCLSCPIHIVIYRFAVMKFSIIQKCCQTYWTEVYIYDIDIDYVQFKVARSIVSVACKGGKYR